MILGQNGDTDAPLFFFWQSNIVSTSMLEHIPRHHPSIVKREKETKLTAGMVIRILNNVRCTEYIVRLQKSHAHYICLYRIGHTAQ